VFRILDHVPPPPHVLCYEIKGTLMGEGNARRDAMLKELTDEFLFGSTGVRYRYADMASKLGQEVTIPAELDRLRKDMEKAFTELSPPNGLTWTRAPRYEGKLELPFTIRLPETGR
jgi:hypothetical protein